MIEHYKILFEGGSGEITEKKSRFIATTKPVKTEREAIEFIGEMKKKYWNANHNCFAYVIGGDGRLCRCGDDGEPGQTAGRPMLDVLLGQEIRDVCVVVARYFGGTLLGAGGLMRAYSSAVVEGLKQSQVVEKELACKINVLTNYNCAGKVQYLLAQMGINVLDAEYTDQVSITVLVPFIERNRFILEVTEGTNGKAKITESGTLYFGISGKEVVLFED